MKIAILTCQKILELPESEKPLVAALEERGAEAICVDWRDHNANWSAFDGVIPKLCWDYYRHIDEFLALLEQLDQLRIPCLNPSNIIRWNCRKRYLHHLEKAGNLVAPTIFIQQDQAELGLKSLYETSWQKIVLKPEVSAGSYLTKVLDLQQDNLEPTLKEVLKHGDAMIQPFFSEIADHGEISLVFIGGTYCHGVLKKPKSGDFRSQPQFGADVAPISYNRDWIHEARSILEAIPFDAADQLIYSRVDGFLRDGKFVLMELELIEPYLFLEHGSSESVNVLARTICDRLNLFKNK
ncbi:ATP-grasp domain-containing protein [Pseudobacteriovorax antillogorgiicola]|uniref:Glutathione synthetase, ATP-grasp domain n=1 Tax=Pseudobacteriovorax antillogorgiicola TaxID=1513793 RepID=A0A1Y6BMG8_9BACT|nr:hypothetical protein [Pseudobacteriovorax antillogorgiicola]TCS54572.1 hypothetical protein EDD56_10685 [Pseudobacteriovorax antillogorgiicola]SMF18048.1 hypothetical protein SAMN06296036_106158 [Pseudobacteriovorax antillogorgiicola]